jgi:starch phosphorylase
MAEMSQLKRKQSLPDAQSVSEEEAALRDAIHAKLTYSLGKSFKSATDNDWFHATALAVRDRLVDIWMASRTETKRLKKKRVYYLCCSTR